MATANGRAQYDHPVKRRDCLLIEPEHLVLEEDKDGPLFDPRARLAPDEALVQLMMSPVGTELSAILVVKEGGRAKVVAGRRRVVAAREANRRRAEDGKPALEMTCLVKTGEEQVLLGMMIAENEHRLNDTPLNKARKLQTFLDLGGSMDDAIELFGAPEKTLRALLALQQCSVKVRALVEKGALPLAQARKLAKLDPAKQEEEADKRKREPKVKGKKGKKDPTDPPTAGPPRVKGKAVLEKLRLQLELGDLGASKKEAEVARDLLDYILGRCQVQELNSALVKALIDKAEDKKAADKKAAR